MYVHITSCVSRNLCWRVWHVLYVYVRTLDRANIAHCRCANNEYVRAHYCKHIRWHYDHWWAVVLQLCRLMVLGFTCPCTCILIDLWSPSPTHAHLLICGQVWNDINLIRLDKQRPLWAVETACYIEQPSIYSYNVFTCLSMILLGWCLLIRWCQVCGLSNASKLHSDVIQIGMPWSLLSWPFTCPKPVVV